MGTKYLAGIALCIKDCEKCGGVFAMPKKRDDRLSSRGGYWWCATCGHQWHYGYTEALKRRDGTTNVATGGTP